MGNVSICSCSRSLRTTTGFPVWKGITTEPSIVSCFGDGEPGRVSALRLIPNTDVSMWRFKNVENWGYGNK